MKGIIKEFNLVLNKVQIGVCSKASIPQADCIIIDDDIIVAYDGNHYVECEIAPTGFSVAINYDKIQAFFRNMPEAAEFSMKLKDSKLMLRCGKHKQNLTIEECIMNPALVYRENLDEVEWLDLGASFKETLMQKKYTHVDFNSVLFNIQYTPDIVVSTDQSKLYCTKESPVEDTMLVPASVADILSKTASPIVQYSLTDRAMSFVDEQNSVYSFNVRVEDYPPIVAATLQEEVSGHELDLGETEIKTYISSSTAVSKKFQNGESIFKLDFDDGTLRISTGTDRGDSKYVVEVHNQETVSLSLVESVLKDIMDMGGEFTYDGESKIKIDSPTFSYMATTVKEVLE